MESLKINNTPVRTSRNYNANNIKIENFSFPKTFKKFEDISIIIPNEKNVLENDFDIDKNITYGLGEEFNNLIENSLNYKLKITINNKRNNNTYLTFNLSKNKNLVSYIEINTVKGARGTIFIRFEGEDDKYFVYSRIKANIEEKSNIKVVVLNFLNDKSSFFSEYDSNVKESAKFDFNIAELGAKYSISNYYSNLSGDFAKNYLNTIYIGKSKDLTDINYIIHENGKSSEAYITVEGALKDEAVKHFKGTIDFKRGCKKAIGSEKEFCTLLSDKARSLSLPMLLCTEEDVEGSHSSASGKIGEKELFYILSRGFNEKDAKKLLVRARFNKIIENISNEKYKMDIIKRIDEVLD